MTSDMLNDNGKWSNKTKAMDGDQSYLTFPRNDLRGLIEYRDSLSVDELRNFKKVFGRISSLIDVDIDEDSIRALIKFFEPKLKTFVLPKLDLTPTIEEYRYIVSPTLGEDGLKVYEPDLSKIVRKGSSLNPVLQQYFGLDIKWLIGALIGDHRHVLINWEKIYQKAKIEGGIRDKGDVRINFLALGIFGLVLFPSAQGRVDSRMMDLVVRIIEHSRGNVMNMVLAETLRTCTFVKIHKKSQFKCCAQMLTLWIHTHFSLEGNVWQGEPYANSAWNKEVDLIKNLQGFSRRSMTEEEWYDWLNTLIVLEVFWRAPWLKKVDKCLVSPKGHICFPLFRLYEMVTYNPSKVVQQFGYEQDEPC